MFSATPQKLFRPLSSLSSFKLHQPLPLGPRESKQLLDLLTSSFRQQLDSPLDNGDGMPPVNVPATILPNRRKVSQPQPQCPAIRPVDRHLNDLLSDPLFSHETRSSSLTRLHEPAARGPMQVFDEACARGLMTPASAGACLKAKQRAIKLSSATSVEQTMAESGSGAKVLQWLSRNGHVNMTTFTANTQLVSILSQFLMAEAADTIVWRWVLDAMNNAHTSVTTVPKFQLARTLLWHYMKGLARVNVTLDKTYVAMADLKALTAEMGGAASQITTDMSIWLARITCSKNNRYLPADITNYNRFVSTVTHKALQARLHLHHPVPSAAAAVKFLRQWQPTKKDGMDVTALGLDLAGFYIRTNQLAKARVLMQWLQGTFPKELGVDDRTSHRLDVAMSEASNLELLQALRFA